ncbi:LysE family translocator [Paludibacterium paludis]|uniref:Amino acid transporter LysE n=1 Tax=Paludibacterium paludis TaxID=1225769 RepID=A0A918P246_9NEIS|nr:LysE family transporter [Paludibacterium paludis]GGY14863.1 amino acid transporter LysE [Paludibacterium paludis]
MNHYPLFLAMATVTVLSPGPGVLFTLTNSLRYGMRGALGGIAGIALGALVVAAISATSIGVVLSTSLLAFTIMKFVGAAYLVYLGVRMWLRPAVHLEALAVERDHRGGFFRRCAEGLSLQLTNPKAIFFFISIFPQFIDASSPYVPQFSLLVLTYSGLVMLIHYLYACTAERMKRWLHSPRGGRALSRLGGATFVVFGAMLASAGR